MGQHVCRATLPAAPPLSSPAPPPAPSASSTPAPSAAPRPLSELSARSWGTPCACRACHPER
ncbi:MAG: hypothetical protein DRP63_10065 [Planctomycetota bacterium]|nr:MAG: hypothetical protein DRP63_10065 [Planctomycetota bacterium]